MNQRERHVNAYGPPQTQENARNKVGLVLVLRSQSKLKQNQYSSIFVFIFNIPSRSSLSSRIYQKIVQAQEIFFILTLILTLTNMSLGAFPHSGLLLSHRFPDSLHLLLVSCPVPLRTFLGLFESLLQ